MIYQGPQGEYFEISDRLAVEKFSEEGSVSPLTMIWFEDADSELMIDGMVHRFETNESLFLTQFHQIEIMRIGRIQVLHFNRSFFCILDHDSEVGCKGILFYGAATLPIIRLNESELDIFQTAWKMAKLEFKMKDDLQQEMLQMMLKRLLILSTRIYKKLGKSDGMDEYQHDLVREFNFLVEQNFRTMHTVKDYAGLLFKSPKTISNVFNKLGEKSPLKFIQERIMLEARRLLYYTAKDISEIAYELGFNDVQTFSRFFKKMQGSAPSSFREQRA